MTIRVAILVALLCTTAFAQTTPAPQADQPVACARCEAWNAPQAPFRVFGNTYYVGRADLGSVLITSEQGHVLIDGAIPQSAAEIERSIRQLGFRPEDIRLIANSHEHFDHVGGIAELQRITGARVVSSPIGAEALRRGVATEIDPQYRSATRFPPVKNVRAVQDHETLRVGDVAVTAHFTPGHTPGSTTWAWRSCEGTRCLDIVYADSLNSVSSEGFRFSGDATHASIVGSFRTSIARVAALPCDILLAPHAGFVNLGRKYAALTKNPSENPFIDPQACRVYAAGASERLDRRVAEEAASAR